MCKKKNLFKINLKKLLKIIIMLLFIIILIIAFNKSYAEEVEIPSGPEAGITAGNVIMGLLNGLLGIILWIPGVLIGLIVVIIPYLILSLLFSLIGNVNFPVTPADIFFNRIPLLSVDFFDFSGGTLSLISLRTTIAKWFVTLSGVSLVFLLGVLIYIAIRAVLASTGQSKAKYHKMFVNWLISLGLLGLLGVIIVGSISLNNIFVRIVEKASIMALDGQDFSSVTLKLIGYIFTPLNFIRQVTASILLAVITYQTFKYAFIYIKRMIKIAFLVMISPLITITYSIDKIADNKSQALNTWMHVFIFNVFIQTFHALIFAAFFTIAFTVSVDATYSWSIFGTFSNRLPGTIIAIMSLRFIGDGERIIRQIFNITDGEKLPGSGQLVKFALLQKGLDYSSKKLKESEEKEKKSRFFERTFEEKDSQTVVRDSGAPQIAEGSPDIGGEQEEYDDIGDGASPRVQEAQATLDESIEESMGDYDEPTEAVLPKGEGPAKSSAKFLASLSGKRLLQTSALLGGMIVGVASGDIATTYQLMRSGKNIGKMLDTKREGHRARKRKRAGLSKAELYTENTKDAAKEALQTYNMSKLINGEEADVYSQEGIEDMQRWFRMIEDKASSGQLLKEYAASKEALLKKIESLKGVTRAQANQLLYTLGDKIMDGVLPEEGTEMGEIFSTKEGKNFAFMTMERKQMYDKQQYTDMETDIKGVNYNYQNVTNLLDDPEIIAAVSQHVPYGEEVPEATPIPSRPEAEGSTTEEEARPQAQAVSEQKEEPASLKPEEKPEKPPKVDTQGFIDYEKQISEIDERLKQAEKEKRLIEEQYKAQEKEHKKQSRLYEKAEKEESSKRERDRIKRELDKAEETKNKLKDQLDDANIEIEDHKSEKKTLKDQYETLIEEKDQNQAKQPKAQDKKKEKPKNKKEKNT